MIDLTPLDVRKKRGDFRKVFRGYDPEEVDVFLEVVAERFETLVNENMTLRERTDRLEERVSAQESREKAVQEALVTAQELREATRRQARREADHLRNEAEAEAERVLEEAERRLRSRKEALEELERTRTRFLRSFRRLLERELDAVEVEESRSPLEEEALEISFSMSDVRSSLPEAMPAEEADEVSAEELTEELGEREARAPAETTGSDPGPDDPVDIGELAPEDVETEADPPPADEPLWLLDEGEDERR